MSLPVELMGAAEIAALLGISRQRVLKLADNRAANRAGDVFPAPLAELSMGRVWDGEQVRKWAAGYTPARPTRSAATGAAGGKPEAPAVAAAARRSGPSGRAGPAV